MAMREITLELPYPPSANHYWRHVGDRVLISEKGRAFRRRVSEALLVSRAKTIRSRCSVSVILYPSDRRKRDIDNTLKSLLDALEHGRAIADDALVDRLEVERRKVVRGGKAVVTIREIEAHA